MQLGPTKEGTFLQVEIESIRCLKELVQSVHAGQICSFAIKPGATADAWLKAGGQLRRGMVLMDQYKEYKATRSFMGEIWTIDGTTKQISTTYQPLINCQHIRQAASIKPNKEATFLDSSPQRQIDMVASLFKDKSPETKDNEMEELPKLTHQRSRSYPKNLFKEEEKSPLKVEVSAKRTKWLFRFLYHPEYLELGSTFVIADSSLHAFGEITALYYDI